MVSSTRVYFLSTVFFLVTASIYAGFGRITYHSPDESLSVTLIPRGLEERQFNENIVEVRDIGGNLLASLDLTSPDADHGQDILHAAWSADSKFFVLSSWSSGGHHSWQTYTTIYHRDRNQFFLLDMIVGPIVRANFFLKAPDILTTARVDSEFGVDGEPITLRLRLGGLEYPKEGFVKWGEQWRRTTPENDSQN